MTTKNKDINPSICNCLNLRRASMSITEFYDNVLSSSGLSISQFSLLRNIELMGPVSVSDLAIALRLDRTTLVRNLKPLEKKGLIIDISMSGTRNRQLELSDKGKVVYLTAASLWQEAQHSIENYLGSEDLITLTTLLNKIENLSSL